MNNIKHTIGSGNVFADIGIQEPKEYLRKATLAVRINERIAQLGLTQEQAGTILGIDQPKVSLLKRGLLDAFSIERLMRFLNALGDPHAIAPVSRILTMSSVSHARGRFIYRRSRRIPAPEHHAFAYVHWSLNAGIPLVGISGGSASYPSDVYAPALEVQAQIGPAALLPGFLSFQQQGVIAYANR